ncbi:MAG TPA: carbamoyltransferase HypF [Thauera sp.]|nr:carbamoyltransferase HypF [Thauera sp.]
MSPATAARVAPGATHALQPLRWAGEGPGPTRPILALGAWFKNAPCLLGSAGALFSPNLGDLDTPQACREVEPAVAALLAATPDRPLAVAHDLHPDFHSTRVALATAARLGVPALGVQHHHAHVGAVLAEHGRFDVRPVLGLALDGIGLGSDGQAWGGELLRVAGAHCERLGHLRPLRLPGGDRAAREPWRMAAALLHACGRGGDIARRFARQPAAAMLAQVLARPALCPPTSSLGRHFDAAAGLLGVCEVMQADAEAAIALETLASAHGAADPLNAGWRLLAPEATHAVGANAPTAQAAPTPAGGPATPKAGAGSAETPPLLQLDLHPLLLHLADMTEPGRGAALFHATLAAALIDWVALVAADQPGATVVLSGGCMHNRILSAALEAGLSARGFEVLCARRLSPGDGGIALGQAWVAWHQLARKDS